VYWTGHQVILKTGAGEQSRIELGIKYQAPPLQALLLSTNEEPPAVTCTHTYNKQVQYSGLPLNPIANDTLSW
jgi:hypothetical protein